MKRAPSKMRMGTAVPSLSLAATVIHIPTAREKGHAERQLLYRSTRWRQERKAFLKANPHCTQPTARGTCGKPSCVADHVDGHQHPDWRARFWDRGRWQAMCRGCHAAKSGRELAAWKGAGSGMVPPGFFLRVWLIPKHFSSEEVNVEKVEI